MTPSPKDSAYDWLIELDHVLSSTMDPPPEMRSSIARMVEEAKASGNKTHHGPEYAFLNGCVVPIIFEQLKKVLGTTTDAQNVFLSEWHRGMPKYHRRSPARSLDHPFEKSRRDPRETINRWRGLEIRNGVPRKPFHQACPDLAICAPFPHRTVFEVKYFVDGDAEAAVVDGIYEAFYYLSMPTTPPVRERSGYDYDYACFLAYDASVDGKLLNVWNSIPALTRSEFWKGGNIYVMLLRPTLSSHSENLST